MNKLLLLVAFGASMLRLAAGPSLTVDATRSAGPVSPRLYGLMTEEINFSYDGGLYAELIRNRAFLDDPRRPAHWEVVADADARVTVQLDPAGAYNAQLTNSLRVTVGQASRAHPAGVANEGYWGIPVTPGTRYRATVIARAEPGFRGPLTVSITSSDGGTTFATGTVKGLGTAWTRHEVTLHTRKDAPTAKGRLRLSLDQPGTVWLGFVSLFPPTWNDQPNGFRRDLLQMLVDLNPKFLRFPGGNYLEGQTIETRFEWKKTLGPVEQRHGHRGPWGYRSTDGLGLLEFLLWCEAMKAEPVLAVYAGYSLGGAYVKPGPDLEPFVQEALEEIEYVIGDVRTPWGARRARDGHPKPFALTYVEIGNEDWFDKSGSYDGRFAQFHDAIKARYPHLKTIASVANDQPPAARVRSRRPDMIDEHYYLSTDEFLAKSPNYARDYDRHGPEIFVGEWAAHEDAAIKPWSPGARSQPPTPSMKAAIGDAAFMAAMERNADLIQMQCYAPLFVNVNPGGRQWRPNLIGYDVLSAYGSPSYYAFQMFSRNVGDEILAVTITESKVQASATRDHRTGEIFLKLVNPGDAPETLEVDLRGVASLTGRTSATTLAASPEATNSLEKPREVVPATTTWRDRQPSFRHTLPAHSVVVLKLRARR